MGSVTHLTAMQDQCCNVTMQCSRVSYLSWTPGHCEEHLQGHLQLLCTVNVPVGRGIRDDCLQTEKTH